MLNIGVGELIIIMGIALVVIGPERFPEFAKIVMRTIRDIRGYVNDVKRDLSNELRPVEKEVKSLSRYDPEDYIESLAESTMAEDEDEDYDTGRVSGYGGDEEKPVTHEESNAEESPREKQEGVESPEPPED